MKYAAHVLAVADGIIDIHRMAIVETNGKGEVIQIDPFIAEEAGVQWLGGMMLVTRVRPNPVSGESWNDLLLRLSALGMPRESPLVLYQVTSFDLSAGQLRPSSRFRLLA